MSDNLTVFVELADAWDVQAQDAEPAARRETLRECADALRMMVDFKRQPIAGQAVSAVPASVPSAAHTPGPWLRIDTTDYAEIHAAFRPSSAAVAMVGKAADADLIAAAPDLLAQLQFAIKLLDGLIGCRGTAQIEAMKATVAKALGK